MPTPQTEIIHFYNIPESSIVDIAGDKLTGAFAIIKCSGKYLFGYNRFRHQWELPAGKIEPGETAQEAAKRELYEETHQAVEDLEFCGLFEIYDHGKKENRFRAVYFAEVEALTEFVATPEDEMEEICLWDLQGDLVVDEVDLQMLKRIMEFCKFI